ncbi:hypothetical protein Thpro_020274 [Acidihalobacter prosperus]|uniref:Uncharacterized protein n=1 Tax=Acidihalobacter prosperus TaxID=160660 RepID=A0A1A6C7L4_9GAMM|nr:hypothetical protein Thpro_020274 [Acidihalobacter prosperus]
MECGQAHDPILATRAAGVQRMLARGRGDATLILGAGDTYHMSCTRGG